MEKKELKVIECSGSYYEIGRQYGKACRESVAGSVETLFRDIGMFQKASKGDIIAAAKKYLPLVER